MHHIDSKESLGKKVLWKLSKDSVFCFKQIMKAVPDQRSILWPLTSHLANHPRRARAEHCSRNKDELISVSFLWILIHQWWPNSRILHYRANTGCHLEDLQSVITDKDGGSESQKNLCDHQTWWCFISCLVWLICLASNQAYTI